MTTGIAPDGKFSPTPASTKFKRYQDLVETREAAEAKFKEDYGPNGLKEPPKPGEKKPRIVLLDHKHPIDDGVVGVGQPTKITDPASGKTGEVYAQTKDISGVSGTKTTYAWDKADQEWKVVQHFPAATGWDQRTQSYPKDVGKKFIP